MRKYFQFAAGYRKFIKESTNIDESIEYAKKTVRGRLKNKEENILKLLKLGVFENSKSPYLNLLKLANYSYKDVEKLFFNNGLESALLQLRNDGVYFTIEEFKGKGPVIRKGHKFHFKEKDFDNPFLKATYEAQSGGSRSAGTRVRVDFDFLAQKAVYYALMIEIHHLKNIPIAIWLPIYPSGPGLNSVLRFVRVGKIPMKWFSQIEKGNKKIAWNKRLGTNYVIHMGRFFGIQIPKPEFVPLNEAATIAKWIYNSLQQFESVCLYTFVSSAVRICIAAGEAGLNISGTKFLVTGEPLTPKKREVIESFGCYVVPIFGVTEGGSIGYACSEPFHCDGVHSFTDSIGIIQHERTILNSDIKVNAFLFSSLLLSSPKIFLNVESGDYGNIEKKYCNCLFGELGLSEHIYNIRSFEKLTSEGVTFVDTDIIRIIEEVFPKKLGGNVGDYQIIEREDGNGITHPEIIVRPDVSFSDDEIISTFLNEIRKGKNLYTADTWSQSGSQMWNQAGSIRVVRTNPIPTKRGKILPFHIIHQ